jgi:uncharacterized protein (TIRG00374 family)
MGDLPSSTQFKAVVARSSHISTSLRSAQRSAATETYRDPQQRCAVSLFEGDVLFSNPTANSAISKRRLFVAIAALGILVYMGIALAVDARRLIEAITQLQWFGCGGIVLLSLCNYALRFERWRLFVKALGHQLPLGRHLLYYLSGFAFTVSPGKAGEAVRSIYLRGHGVSYAESLAAFFCERLLDLLAVVLLASLVVLQYQAYRPLVGGVLLLVVVMLFVVSRPALPQWLKRLSSQRSGRLAGILSNIANLAQHSMHLLRPQLLLVGIAVGILAWAAEGLGFYLICAGMHIDVSVTLAIGIYSVAVLAGSAAFFLPGGIGGMEIVMTTLIVQASGVSVATAVIATLLCRLATLWLAVLIGIVAAWAVELKPRTSEAAVMP